MLISMEAEVYPLRDPGRSIEIEGAMGEGSMFQGTYGYHAHGVGPETVVGPAGRERDWEFARDALVAGLVEATELLRRIDALPEPPVDRAHVRGMLEGVIARLD